MGTRTQVKDLGGVREGLLEERPRVAKSPCVAQRPGGRVQQGQDALRRPAARATWPWGNRMEASFCPAHAGRRSRSAPWTQSPRNASPLVLAVATHEVVAEGHPGLAVARSPSWSSVSMVFTKAY